MEVGDELDEETAAEVAGFVDEHGFLSWLGIEVESVAYGRVRFRLPYDEQFTNLSTWGNQPIHGGVAATLIDTASGFALRTTFEDPAHAGLTTTDLNVKYLRPATDDLTVVAEVERAGDSMGVTDVEVTSTAPDGEEKAVAVGRTSYRLFRDAE
jgi:uncharacterized protein (TIGR00369 family)